MIGKNLDDITVDDLLRLIEDSVDEGKTIEYKQVLPGNSDRDKKEFLADVSSFANTNGGDIIYGMEEEDGLPINLIGLEIGDIDTVKLRLDSSIRSGIEPRIIFHLRVISLEDSKVVLIIRIDNSWDKPHRVIYGGHGKFHARTSAGKYSLDTYELRKAFTEKQQIEENIRRFRTDRVFQIIAGETPVPLANKPVLILHLVPIDSLSGRMNFDISIDRLNNFFPISGRGYNYRHTFDGICNFVSYNENHSYAHLYRNGIIEAAVDSLCNLERKYIPSYSYERDQIDAFQNYISILRNLGVTLPIFSFISMVNYKGYNLTIGNDYCGQRIYPISKNELLLPEIIIETFDIDPSKFLKSSFDLIWNECGLSGSRNYDAEDNWINR